MKQTAVEWLVSNIDWMLLRNSKHHYKMIIEKAKELEKQQQGYSEEEVYHILCEHTAFLFAGGKSTLTEWFEQFKNK